jgi:hypothetical protein
MKTPYPAATALSARVWPNYPMTSDRSRGWLRYLFRKATTPDNWDKEGRPHPHWDDVTGAPTTSWQRFDLLKSCYALPLLCDRTPAWREVYGRILDELITRYTGYWTARDWLEQIGEDPKRKQYPQEYYDTWIPKSLWGNYDVPGWTANGIQPWGLQMDPIGADGNLFFKGDFLILLGFYVYITGDQKWNRPFKIVRNGPDTFTWTYSGIAHYLFEQLSKHPEGCHCENTKIWPLCMSRAGLGLALHDMLYRSTYRTAFDIFWEYARQNYLSLQSGRVVGPVTAYYDPILSFHQTGEHIPLMKIAPAQSVLPLYRDDARALFDAEMALLKWRELPIGVGERKFNPTEVHQAHLLAQEFGEDGLSAKLAEFSDARFGPTWDVATAEFTWRFGLDEEHPRGQLNATAAMAEAGGPDAWWGIVNRPNRKRLAEPTVHGVDFPKVCLSQAVYDPSAAQLIIATDDGVPAHRGEPTTFRISNVVPGNCSVEVDGTKSDNWRIVEGQIEISTTVGNHTVVVRCG